MCLPCHSYLSILLDFTIPTVLDYLLQLHLYYVISQLIISMPVMEAIEKLFNSCGMLCVKSLFF